jgi:SAM-dependent methyltransferase
MSEYLQREGYRVVGIDPFVIPRYDGFEFYNLTLDEFAKASADRFDAIVLMDVIEHLPNPERSLQLVLRLCHAKTIIYITGPNIAHISARIALLLGRWEYQDAGIFDRTHLRFFTQRTWEALISNSGFKLTLSSSAEASPIVCRRLIRKLFGENSTRYLESYLSMTFPRLFSQVLFFEATPR